MRVGKGSENAFAFSVVLILSPSASAQGWQLAEPMPAPRAYHAAAAVGDRWYVAGGLSSFAAADALDQRFPSEVDVYDPASGHWSALGALSQGRDALGAIADLKRSRVIFPGGFLPVGPDGYLALASCDTATLGGVVASPSLIGARNLHGVALAAGKFIVSGGWGMKGSSSWLLDDAEMWDGTEAAWTRAGTMPAGPRSGHTMTTLRDGRRVLVVGGGVSDHALANVDVFDAACGSWSTASPLLLARARHKALLLDDGRVLVVGGSTYPGPFDGQKSAELFDPESGTWKATASMKDGRFDFDMAVLPDGRVIVAGGSNNAKDGEYGALNSVEVYDASADAWSSLPPMHDRRRWPTVAVLSDGVYVAGGTYAESTTPGSATVLATVERLPWADLGLTGFVTLDAGSPGGSEADASTSCASNDAGMDRDGAPDGTDAGDGSDADTDASVRDADSSDRESSGSGSGCTCDVDDAGGVGLVGIAMLALMLARTTLGRARRAHRRR
jgi:N-acetylneuraminic acid mutarotase